MASSRTVGTNEVVFTFGSGAGRDYSSVASWNTDTGVTLTSGYGHLTISNPNAFRGIAGEIMDGSNSGATIYFSGCNAARTALFYTLNGGTPNTSDTFVGRISGFSCDVDAVVSTNTGISPTLECYNDSSVYTLGAGLTVSGGIASASYFRTIRAASACRHGGVSGAGVVFALTSDTEATFNINTGFFRLHDVEMRRESNTGNVDMVVHVENGYSLIEVVGVIVTGANSGAGTMVGFKQYNGGASDTTRFVDCIAFGVDGGYWLRGEGNVALNCTASASAYGFYHDLSGTILAKNCIANNATADFAGDFSASSTNNLSEDATAPAYNTYYAGKALTFNNAAAGDYRLAASDTDAIDKGADLSADTFPFNDDIAYTTRTTWDIGAHEYTSTAQFARPASGVADGNWLNQIGSNANLYASIGEAVVDDAGYIRSGVNPTNDTVEVGLSSVGTPDAGGTITVRVRARVI